MRYLATYALLRIRPRRDYVYGIVSVFKYVYIVDKSVVSLHAYFYSVYYAYIQVVIVSDVSVCVCEFVRDMYI